MKKFICISLFLAVSFFSRGSRALIFDYTPLEPFSVQFCAMCTPAAVQTVTQMYSTVKSVTGNISSDTIVKGALQSLKSYGLNLGKSKLNKLINKERNRKKLVSYSRTIKESTVAGDLTDEEKVKQAFIKLFLQYPSTKSNVKKLYRLKGEQLQLDTALEMYITARELEKDMQAAVINIPNIEKCIVAGNRSTDGNVCDEQGLEEFNCLKTDENGNTKEDKMCLWRNALNVARIYDQIMRYNEFIYGMNVQYQAVRRLNGEVEIMEYEDENKSSSSGSEQQNSLNDVYYDENLQMASSGYSESGAYASVSLDFESADDAGVPNAIEDKDDDFNSFKPIAEAQAYLDDAIKAHNFKRTLPDYRETFKNYHEIEKVHAKVVDRLNVSEDCTVTHLKQYGYNAASFIGRNCVRIDSKDFQNAVINGYENEQTGAMDGYFCHYDDGELPEDAKEYADPKTYKCPDDESQACYLIPTDKIERGGISAWLKEIADIAKAKDSEYYETEQKSQQGLTNIPDEDKAAVEEFIAQKEKAKDKLEEEGAESNETFIISERDYSTKDDGMSTLTVADSKNTAGATDDEQRYKKLSKEDDIAAEARAAHLRHWEIASEIAKGLKNASWTNTSNYYNKYLTYKLEHIIEYIKSTPLFDELTELASKNLDYYLEQTIKEEFENESQQQFASEEERKQYEAAKKKYEEERAALKKAVADGLSVLEPYANKEDKSGKFQVLLAEMDKILAEDKELLGFDTYTAAGEFDRTIGTLEKELNPKLEAHEKAIKTLYAQIDKKNTELSEANDALNDANFDKYNAEDTSIPSSNDAIDYSTSELYSDRGWDDDFIKNSRLQNNATEIEAGSGYTKPKVDVSYQPNIATETKVSEESTKTKAAQELKIKNLKNSIESIQKEIDNHKNQIRLLQAKFVKNFSDSEHDFRVKLDAKVKEYQALEDEYKQLVEKSHPVIKLANAMLGQVRRAVIYKINGPAIFPIGFRVNCRRVTEGIDDALSIIKDIPLDDILKPDALSLKKCGGIIDQEAYEEALSVSGAKYNEGLWGIYEEQAAVNDEGEPVLDDEGNQETSLVFNDEFVSTYLSAADLSILEIPEVTDWLKLWMAEAAVWMENYTKIFADLVDPEETDEEFFVGIVDREEDFKHYRSSPPDPGAPVREIIHFDEADYDLLWKYILSDGEFDTDEAADEWQIKQLTSEDAGNFNQIVMAGRPLIRSAEENGWFMPTIWKVMLRHRTFVQKDGIDLYIEGYHMPDSESGGADPTVYAVTGLGSEEVWRAGIYHCYMDSSERGRLFAYHRYPHTFARYSDSHQCCSIRAYQKCRTINNFQEVIPEWTATAHDIESDSTVSLARNGVCGNPPCNEDAINVSDGQTPYCECDNALGYELNDLHPIPEPGKIHETGPWDNEPHPVYPCACGKFLDATEWEQIFGFYWDSNHDNAFRMTFNAQILSGIKEIRTSASDSADKPAAYIEGRRMMYDHNQIGDWLDYVEGEQTIREVMLQQEIQMKEVREKIQEILSSLDMSLDDVDSLDLSNEDDYKAVEEALDAAKDAKVAALREKIGEIKGSVNVVNSKREQLQHSLEMLEYDSGEQSNMTPDITKEEIDEFIAEAQANQEVTDSAAAEGTRVLKEMTDYFNIPYCASIQEWMNGKDGVLDEHGYYSHGLPPEEVRHEYKKGN